MRQNTKKEGTLMLRVSEVCRETRVQNCHCCDDLGCCDNLSPEKALTRKVATLQVELASLRTYVATLEDDNASLLLEAGGYRGKCLACNAEASLGTPEIPHPVDPRVHTCDRSVEVAPGATIDPRPRNLACGCVTCICEDLLRCHGCGAKCCVEHGGIR